MFVYINNRIIILAFFCIQHINFSFSAKKSTDCRLLSIPTTCRNRVRYVNIIASNLVGQIFQRINCFEDDFFMRLILGRIGQANNFNIVNPKILVNIVYGFLNLTELCFNILNVDRIDGLGAFSNILRII